MFPKYCSDFEEAKEIGNLSFYGISNRLPETKYFSYSFAIFFKETNSMTNIRETKKLDKNMLPRTVQRWPAPDSYRDLSCQRSPCIVLK
jgi:hypothetical protein